ncbi:MAG: hypothetical protein Ct9H300mP31_10150 [Acidimicrobiaceae bacterium]|nr:MAG: hypothetical protein Ct9H300mP31_10150 [Acidimicrobiaceae bacterium]
MCLNLGSNVKTSGSAFFRRPRPPRAVPPGNATPVGNRDRHDLPGPHDLVNPMVKIGRQVIEHLRQHKNVNRREAKQTALDLLNEVRIPEAESRIDRLPHELSGGMRQRVSIASALACEPSLLFADEPTTALDVTVPHQILNLLSREQRQRNMTMVMVTHDLGVIAGRTDDTLVCTQARSWNRLRRTKSSKRPNTRTRKRSCVRFREQARQAIRRWRRSPAAHRWPPTFQLVVRSVSVARMCSRSATRRTRHWFRLAPQGISQPAGIRWGLMPTVRRSNGTSPTGYHRHLPWPNP